MANPGGEKPFPSSAGQLLTYADLRLKGGAKKTTLTSLVSALRFLEKAGEVPEGPASPNTRGF